MKDSEFKQLTGEAGNHLIRLMMEGKEKLDLAMEAVTDEAADQETTPVLKIGFSIAMDLDTRKAEFTLAFGVRHKLTSEVEIEDPDQGELAIDGDAAKPKRKRAKGD